jgi:hypothetical protein
MITTLARASSPSISVSSCATRRHLAALGRDRIELVDEDDRGRVGVRFLEHLAQPLFRFAIGAAHDLRTVDQEEAGVALVGDRACKPRLAGARRPMEQHALGRIDAQPLEQLGIAQRQLDHLAQLVDCSCHAADIVISDVGAAQLLGFLEVRAQLDLGILVDMDDPARRRRHHGQADFLQRISGCAQMLEHIGRHVRYTLLADGRDGVALCQRAPDKGAFQRIGRPFETQILACRREHHACRRARFAAADLDEIAGSDAGIGALESVDAQQLESLVLGIRKHGACRRHALADNLDHIALLQAQLCHQRAWKMGKAASAVFGTRIGDLKLACRIVGIGHWLSFPANCRVSAPDRHAVPDRLGKLVFRWRFGQKKGPAQGGQPMKGLGEDA